ncbi:MAG: polysaccharide deacetylase family protein [Clostridia bacterium]|nr:polysaccharide deacetylase family protein [Clostridia bacterium]
MKKIFTLLFLTFVFTITAIAGVSNKKIEWYYKPTCDGTRPSGALEAHFLSEYDAHFIGKDEKCVYLTFDLGYENENVFKILDTLKKEDVPATFFLLRHTVVNGDSLERIIEDGHCVGNHTSHHKDMTKMGDINSFKEELLSLEEDFTRVTGKELSKLYRPPAGAFSEENLAWAKELGYKTVLWSLAYADWDEKAQMSPDAAMNKLMSRMHNGAVILLHPTSSTNAQILEGFIKKLKADGYTFKTADDL